MQGTGLQQGRQTVPRVGKREAGPKSPADPKPRASLPQCRTQPCRRLGPGVCLEPGPWWMSPWSDWLHRAQGSPGFAISRGTVKNFVTSCQWARLAVACLPNISLVKDCQLPLRQSRQRFRSVGFASRNVCYRQVALRRCPLQAVVSVTLTCRNSAPTPAQGQACAGGLGYHAHPLPPPRFFRSSQPRRALPAPGSAFGPSPSVRVLSRARSRSPMLGEPDSGSSPGAGPGAAETDTLL